MLRVLLTSLLLVLLSAASLAGTAGANVLHGRVEKEDYRLRLQQSGQGGAAPAGGEVTRLNRAGSPLKGSAVDTTAFAPLLPGTARQDALQGVVSDFTKLPRHFDIGAERGSREMVLAWEHWHKQLSETIYSRWSARARSPGRATVRITVTRDRQIRADVLNHRGDGEFIATVMEAILGLDGNAGLTFPANSQRQYVSFEADYLAASNVTPGYSWVRNDYERIRKDY